ncbi:MAG: VanZ family protein [Cytophagaceae bacterium]|nr:MAG: VanZ family protein [Cytophagaceae bacterium]
MKLTPILFRWLAIVWTVIMLIGCLTPHSELPDELVSWNDKAQHIAIFALFTLLWRLAGLKLATAAVVGVLFGALIEALQYVLPINRSADWADLFADSIGVILGMLLVPVAQKVVDSISSKLISE